MKFKSSRTSIGVDANQLTDLADAHIGASMVLLQVQSADPMGFMVGTALHLDDMNMRGEQIYIAFRWACEAAPGNTAAGPFFVEAVKRRDPEMVAYVNKHFPPLPGEEAVTSGAAYARRHNRR